MSATLTPPTTVMLPMPEPQTTPALSYPQREFLAALGDDPYFTASMPSGLLVYRVCGPLMLRDLVARDGRVLDSETFRAGPADRERARRARAAQAIGESSADNVV